MGRRPNLYVPLTVGFLDDPRIIEVRDGPTLLYLAMMLKAKALGSDGRLTESQIGRLNRPRWKPELARLAEVGLVVWDDDTGDWFISAWFAHNDAVSVIEERRAADRKRKADSARNPDGFRSEGSPDSLLVVERSKEKRSKGIQHAFADDGSGCCSVCRLPAVNRGHATLRAVEDAS